MENVFTTADAVAFGNYLLFDERRELFKQTREVHAEAGFEMPLVEDSLKEVHHADVENFVAASSL